MASPSLRDYFSSTVELYSTFIKQMNAENIQLNVSEVSVARGKGGNVSNTSVDDRFFEKHKYHALTPQQNNTLRLKRLKHVHVGNGHGGNGHGENGNGTGKGPKIK
jgi:hypothetical protein